MEKKLASDVLPWVKQNQNIFRMKMERSRRLNMPIVFIADEIVNRLITLLMRKFISRFNRLKGQKYRPTIRPRWLKVKAFKLPRLEDTAEALTAAVSLKATEAAEAAEVGMRWMRQNGNKVKILKDSSGLSLISVDHDRSDCRVRSYQRYAVNLSFPIISTNASSFICCFDLHIN